MSDRAASDRTVSDQATDRATVLDFATLGETMAAISSAGSLALGGPLTVSIAGAESNVAIGLARLGHTTAMFGATGADSFGALIRRILMAEGVDASGLRTTPSAPTGIIAFERPVGGFTNVDYFRAHSAGSRIDAADGASAAAARPRILHLTGITPALSDTARVAVEQAASQAREYGALISLDVNYRSKLWSREEAAEVLRPLAQLADIVLASPDELALVAPEGSSAREMAEALSGGDRRQVVVKSGSSGAAAHHNLEWIEHPGYRVAVVEAIGAGDAFAAGYLSATLDGLDITERLERGCALGAFAVTSPGDWEGLPRRDQLHILTLSKDESLR